MADMRFRCPNCGHVQSLQDFINLGMTKEEATNRVYFSCIGRFNKDQSHNGTLGDGKSPCDYTCGGLIKLGDIIHDGKEDIYTFPFAD
jgi:hypothetical protein